MTTVHRLPFPIETKEAQKFWASSHLCNRMKAIISFSETPEQAMALMRCLEGWSYHLRKRALTKFGVHVNNPSMLNTIFSELSTPWYEELSGSPDTLSAYDVDLTWMETVKPKRRRKKKV